MRKVPAYLAPVSISKCSEINLNVVSDRRGLPLLNVIEREKKDLPDSLFNCNWKDNKCAGEVHRNSSSSVMSCCSYCSSAFGYFKYTDLVTKNQYEFLVKNFKKIPESCKGYREYNKLNEQGFWRKGSGCIIPKKWRSSICITYMCNECYTGKTRPKAIWSLGKLIEKTREKFEVRDN